MRYLLTIFNTYLRINSVIVTTAGLPLAGLSDEDDLTHGRFYVNKIVFTR